MTPESDAFARLPTEVISAIFEYLDLSECLACMTVCRLWRESMPYWTADQQKSMSLTDQTLASIQNAPTYIRQIVNKVVVERYAGSYQSCLVKLAALDLMRLESLDMRGMRLNRGYFGPPSSLKQVGRQLRELRLAEAWGKADIFGVLTYCPRLTHFSLHYGHSHGTHLVNPVSQHAVSTTYPQLQRLNLARSFDLEELVTFVRQCPALTHLRIVWPKNGINIQQVLSACPMLQGFSVGLFVDPSKDPWWRQHGNGKKTRQELELAAFEPNEFEQAITITALQIPCLQRLEFRENLMTRPASNVIQRRLCVPADPPLEELLYESETQGMHIVLEPLVEQCQRLRRVSICLRDTSPSIPDRVYQALGHNLPYLHHLCLHDSDDSGDRLVHMLQAIRNRSVPLHTFEYAGPALLAHSTVYDELARIPTLRHLRLNGQYCGSFDERSGTRFLQLLCASRTIETLVLQELHAFDSTDAFVPLQHMAALKRLSLDHCGWLDEQGFCLLMDQHPPHLKHLDICAHLYPEMEAEALSRMVTYAKQRIHQVSLEYSRYPSSRLVPFPL